LQVGAGWNWIATLDEETQKELIQEQPIIEKMLAKKWGDRETELVFIGIKMPKEKIISALEKCLLTDEEMSMDWASFGDPFPVVVIEENVEEKILV